MTGKGLPLAFVREGKTWRYTAAVVELSPTIISSEDRRDLLFSLQALTQFEATPVHQQLRRAVRFTGPKTPKIKAKVWSFLLLALESRESLLITYKDGQRGKQTKRKIDPYGLIMRDRHWILIAYCHLKKMVLTFSVSRIADAELTDDRFEVAEDFMDRYFENAIDGYQTTGTKEHVVLRIPKNAPPFVHEHQWTEKQKVRVTSKKDLIISFDTAAFFSLKREVLSRAPWSRQPVVGQQRSPKCRPRVRPTGGVPRSAQIAKRSATLRATSIALLDWQRAEITAVC